jgi:hypothetical protein
MQMKYFITYSIYNKKIFNELENGHVKHSILSKIIIKRKIIPSKFSSLIFFLFFFHKEKRGKY